MLRRLTPSNVAAFLITFGCGALAAIVQVYGHFEDRPAVGRIAVILACLGLAVLPRIVGYHRERRKIDKWLNQDPWTRDPNPDISLSEEL
jgi:hypothetical protein